MEINPKKTKFMILQKPRNSKLRPSLQFHIGSNKIDMKKRIHLPQPQTK